MKVRIDESLCTGDGICEEVCPEVFEVREDGVAHVLIDDEVPEDLEEAVHEAADQCPSACIYIE